MGMAFSLSESLCVCRTKVKAPRYEGVLGKWRYSSKHSSIWH